MDQIGEIRLRLPAEAAAHLGTLSNVHIPDSRSRDTADLEWEDVQNIAAVVTIVGGVAALPGQVDEIANIIAKAAERNEKAYTCVIEGDLRNSMVIISGLDDKQNLTAALEACVVWKEKQKPENRSVNPPHIVNVPKPRAQRSSG